MKKKKQKQSARTKRPAFLSLMPRSQSGSTSTLSKLYLDCSKLPLDRFIDCIVDNDLQALIIEGTATEDQLSAAWDKIYTQFAELSSDGSYNEVFEVSKEIEDLRGKINLADGIIYHLQLSYDQELVDILNVLNLQCKLNPEDIGDVLINKLNQVVGRAKKWLIRLKQRRKDLSKLRENNTGKMDRDYFDEQLNNITLYTQTSFEASKLTVSRFCKFLSRMQKAADKAEFDKKFKKK